MIKLTYRKINNDYFLIINNNGKIENYSVKETDDFYDEAILIIDEIFDTYNYITNSELSNLYYTKLLDVISKPTLASNYINELSDNDSENTQLEIDSGYIKYQGIYLSGELIDRILKLKKDGVREAKPLICFLNNLMDNPSYRVHDQLFEFLAKGNTAITNDGHFLAYKYVNHDFTSAYDNKTMHKIGTYVEMPRHMVDDNPDNTCSHGLHVCSNEYLDGYAKNKKILQIKVNPKDVVSVPTDYNSSKMRVCKYFVEAELTKDQVDNDYLASKSIFYSDPVKKEKKDKEIDNNDYYALVADNSNYIKPSQPRDSKGRFTKRRLPNRDSKGRFIKGS